MAVSFFAAYSQEVAAAAGEENISLIERIDAHLNSPECDVSILEISEDEARRAAQSEGIDERRYFAYLGFLHEIEYRKRTPAAHWGRHPAVVPCPDWILPNSRQIPSRRMPAFRVFSKICSIAMIVVIFGAFPLFVAPVSHSIVVGGGFSLRAATVICAWIAAVLAVLVCHCAMRLLRRRPVIDCLPSCSKRQFLVKYG